jgi:cytochrome c biogenesis protein CcmG/thiol:disulfide interchange protein DsbE
MRPLNFLPIFLFAVIIVIAYLSLNYSSNNVDKLTEVKLELNNGEILDLKELHGRPYIIRLFASWCSACKEDSLQLKELSKRMNAPIIGIAINDDIEKVKLLEEKEKLPYNYIAIDSDSRLKKLLNNKVLPETIIVDKDGNIILRHQGSF